MDLHPDKKPVESCDGSNPDDKKSNQTALAPPDSSQYEDPEHHQMSTGDGA